MSDLSLEIKNLKELLSDLMVKAGGLKELQRKETEGGQKNKKLQQKLDNLTLKAEDLKTLKSMFHRSGFVNYVSTIFLRNLSGSESTFFQTSQRFPEPGSDK
ncbi:MAG: hypothetical protein R3B93_04105 [Bacteroidia bacterium]